MGKLSAFTFITLNGFYKDENNQTSWHVHGKEAGAYSEEKSSSNNILLFGRKTYEMMASFWPSQMAKNAFPIVASNMNSARKIVFSNTLKKADWEHTEIVNGNILEAVQKLKNEREQDLTLLGSGKIHQQFTKAGLIDTYEIMIDPVLISEGTALFNNNLELDLVESRTFKGGVVLVVYNRKK